MSSNDHKLDREELQFLISDTCLNHSGKVSDLSRPPASPPKWWKFQRATPAVTDGWRRSNQPEFNICSIKPLAADAEGSNVDAAGAAKSHALKVATF